MKSTRLDLTGNFKQLISTLQTRSDLELPVKDPQRILKTKKKNEKSIDKFGTFERRARDIINNIFELELFLREHRRAYLDVWNERYSVDAYSDVERDRIDAGANKFISTSNQLINQFKSDLTSVKEELTKNKAQHLEAVCSILEQYLKNVCDIFSEQKAIRIQKELEAQKLSRLEFSSRKDHSAEDLLESRNRLLMERLKNNEQEKIDSENSSETENPEIAEDPEDGKKEAQKKEPSNSNYKYNYNHSIEAEEEARLVSELSPEERKLLEAENEQLYSKLRSTQDAVQQIETKVVKIAELQEVFTEKVLQQRDDINLVNQNTVASTENIKDGNEEIRKAIQNQASIRVYVLFFLLVMSFSLLFLDWYND